MINSQFGFESFRVSEGSVAVGLGHFLCRLLLSCYNRGREGCERACPPSLALFLSCSFLRRRNDNILRLSNGGTIFVLESDHAAQSEMKMGLGLSPGRLRFRQFGPTFRHLTCARILRFFSHLLFNLRCSPSLLSQATHAISADIAPMSEKGQMSEDET